jgi:hypothetical protein
MVKDYGEVFMCMLGMNWYQQPSQRLARKSINLQYRTGRPITIQKPMTAICGHVGKQM